MSDLQLQLQTLYGGREGLVRLSYIDGDPRHNEPLKTYEWYKPQQRKYLQDDVQYLANRFGNVYASQVPHKERHQTYPTALPSNVLWLDDVQAIYCTMLVETSPNNHQAYMCLDRDLPADERRNLMRRLRQFHGADDCSSDAVHNVRVIGAFNTKRHQHFEVALKEYTGKIYRVEELNEMLPALNIQTGIDVVPLDLDAVNLKRGNAEKLLKRLEWHIKDNQNKHNPALWYRELQKAKVSKIDDWSATRHRLVYGFACIGFPDDEIAALLWALHDLNWISFGHLEGKNSRYIDEDITRCLYGSPNSTRTGVIPYIEQRHAKNNTTFARTETKHIDYNVSRANTPATTRKKRPQTLTEEQYFSWLRENAVGGVVLMNVAECATVFNVSTKTIQRLEAKLSTTGRIEKRKQLGKHQTTVKIVRVDSHAADITNNDTGFVRVDNQPETPEQAPFKGGQSHGVSTLENVDLSDCAAVEENPNSYIDTHLCGMGLVGELDCPLVTIEHNESNEDSGIAAQAAKSVSISTAHFEHEQTSVTEELTTQPEFLGVALDSMLAMVPDAPVLPRSVCVSRRVDRRAQCIDTTHHDVIAQPGYAQAMIARLKARIDTGIVSGI